LLCILIVTGMNSFIENFTSNVEFDFAEHNGFL
jgi:hypothetical protein